MNVPCDVTPGPVKVNAGGRTSFTTMSVAVSGPRLVSVTMNVIDSPTAGIELLTDFATDTEAVPVPFTTARAASFAGLGSGSVCAVLRALLNNGPEALTCAASVRVADAPAAMASTVHSPVTGS